VGHPLDYTIRPVPKEPLIRSVCPLDAPSGAKDRVDFAALAARLNRLRKNSISQKVQKMDRVRMPQERPTRPRRRFSITNSEGILTSYRVFPQPVKSCPDTKPT
jgi:hypothetical protein